MYSIGCTKLKSQELKIQSLLTQLSEKQTQMQRNFSMTDFEIAKQVF